MTVKEKIKELNSDFQKCYWDKRHDFFSYMAPEMIEAIKTFMISIVPEGHELSYTINPIIGILNDQAAYSKEGNKDTLQYFKTKDHHLNFIKGNVSEACWRFNHALWNFNERMLNEVI